MSGVRPALAREIRVKEILQVISDEVGTYSTPVMQKMLPVLAQAESELARDLGKFFGANRGKFTAQHYRNALLQIREALATARRLQPVLYDALAGSRPALGRAAVRHVRQELELFSEVFAGSVRPIAIEAAAVIAVGEKTAMTRYGTVARSLGEDAERHIKQQLAVGLVRGESLEETKKRLIRSITTEDAMLRVIGNDAQVGRLAADVIMRRVNSWSERIVRTETINAYNVVADDAIRAAHAVDPDIQRLWNAANDRRVCSDCRSLDLVVTDVGKPFPGGIDSPTLHPHCRCVVTCWRSDWAL
jgi:hypothetical protein